MKDPQFPIISYHFWNIFSRRHCRAGGGGPFVVGFLFPSLHCGPGERGDPCNPKPTRRRRRHPHFPEYHRLLYIAVTDISA